MKIAIFEDEMHNAERLTHLLRAAHPDLTVTAVIGSVSDGLAWLAEEPAVDLLFMDIQLSDGNCFDLFRQRPLQTPVIFTTAYDNFALQAFKVNSIDYLMKPIDATELANALSKFRNLRPVHQTIDIGRIADEFLRRDSARFIGKLNNQIIYVKARDISYLHFHKGALYATTFQQQQMPLDYSLDQIEKLLDRLTFFRINRQLIVNIDAIKKITAYYNSRLMLQLQPQTTADIVVSRERVADFKRWLEGKSSRDNTW